MRKNVYNIDMSKYTIRTLSEKEELMKFYQQHGWKETFKKYRVSRASFAHWLQRVKSADAATAHPLARRRLIRPDTVAYVKQLRKKHPEFSLAQIKEDTCNKQQKISRTTIWHIINGR